MNSSMRKYYDYYEKTYNKEYRFYHNFLAVEKTLSKEPIEVVDMVKDAVASYKWISDSKGARPVEVLAKGLGLSFSQVIDWYDLDHTDIDYTEQLEYLGIED